MAWSTSARIERPGHPSKKIVLRSKLVFCFLGMAPVLVPLRPSSEHILIVRVREQGISTGVSLISFIVGVP